MRLIDADGLKKSVIKRLGISDEKFLLAAENTLYEEIEKVPTVDAEPVRHGKWLFIRMDEDGNGLYECSLCHKGETHVPQVKVNYCWNCGAKMESEEK